MSTKMKILDFIGTGNLSLGLILGITSWLESINYSLLINVLTVLSLSIGIIYVFFKTIKFLINWINETN